MPGGKGGAQRVAPFDSATQGSIINPLLSLFGGSSGGGGNNPHLNALRAEQGLPPLSGSGIGAGGALDSLSVPGIQSAIRGSNPLEQGASQAFQGPFGGASFLQGGAGSLGTAGGLFGQAQQAVGSDPLGARPAFQNFLSQGFTDVQNDPNVQRLLASQASGVQSLLNRNLGEIGASAQRASGGVGSGSGETASKTRAVTQAAGALANQQAQTLFGEQARRQGLQLAAAQQGIGQGSRDAGLLGQLGSGLGQLGLGAGGLGSQLLGQQVGLGGAFQGRNVGAELFPLEQVFRLGNLLKSTATAEQPSFLDNLSEVGTAAAGIASAIALSDERLKEDVKDAASDVRKFLDDLEAYSFKYKKGQGRHVGVMAQDAERTEVGKGFVVETDEGKAIHLGLGFGAILASLAEINKRLIALEGRDAS